MVEKDLEAKIVSAVSTAVTGKDAVVRGAWSVASGGAVKNVVAASAADIVVVVAPRSYDTETIPTAAFTVVVTVRFRTECDATGSGVLGVVEPIQNLFQSWQDDFGDADDDLSVSNVFNFAGVAMNGGDFLLDDQKGVWTWSQSLTIRGVIL